VRSNCGLTVVDLTVVDLIKLDFVSVYPTALNLNSINVEYQLRFRGTKGRGNKHVMPCMYGQMGSWTYP